MSSIGDANYVFSRQTLAKHVIKAYIHSNMNIVLGSGRMAEAMIRQLADQIVTRQLENISVVCTSEKTHRIAKECNIKCITDDYNVHLHLALDGADAIDCNGNITKGFGGALYREKLYERRAEKRVYCIEDSKYDVPVLKKGISIEIAKFGYKIITDEIISLDFFKTNTPIVDYKKCSDNPNRFFVTDNGNYVLTLRVANSQLKDSGQLERLYQQIASINGVLSIGLFLFMDCEIFIINQNCVFEKKIFGQN